MKNLILFISVFVLFNSCSNSEDPSAINVELQSLEIEIYAKIDQGDKAGALNLLKNLSHPSDKEWKEKRKMDDWEYFKKGGNQYYTYNEWWSERREYLRKEIEKVKSHHRKTSTDKESKSIQNHSTNEEKINRIIEIPIRYLGLYVFQYENGSTQFYKIFKDSDNIFSAIYQDNISGNIRIENYIVKDFDQTTGEIKLQSKKDNRSISELKFLKDSESENGFKLIDIKGLEYSYVQ
jgi:hypothetical protein